MVIAPGGKPVIICDAHMKIARAKSIGVVRRTAGLKSIHGLDLMENSSSIVDTFKVETRRRYQRYWTKATAREALRKIPKLFARIFEAVEMYD